MICPNCQATLQMSERANVEIDYCPNCRGVWLDRGELDKILDRAGAEAAPRADFSTSQSAREPKRSRDDRPRDRDYDDRKHYDDDYTRRPKKRESWLGDIFDF